jgi:uncharacterized protein YhfF
MIGEKTAETEAFWKKACEIHGLTGSDYHCLTFGNPKYQDYSDHITELAIKRVKRATAHMVMDFEINNVTRRKQGDYWMILWEDLSPAVIVELIKVEERDFKDVDAEFAAREGEGDGSLEFWKQCHEEYFKLQLSDWGREWSEDIRVVLESFEVVMKHEV